MARIEPTFSFLSQRIPYDITNLSALPVSREMVVGIQIKEIFSNKRLFMGSQATQVYNEYDQRIYLDMFGIDKLNTKMLIG